MATRLAKFETRSGSDWLPHCYPGHGHLYHPEFDAMERELVSSPGWKRSPLQEGDEE